MWLLLVLCLTSSLIHSVQMLKCFESDVNSLNSSLTNCPDNHQCGLLRGKSGNVSHLWQSCIPEISCNLTFVLYGNGNATQSCCNTDGCNNGSLSEHYAAPDGLKCDSCINETDKLCNIPLSCVGIKTCCFNMTYSWNTNVTLKGCAPKNLFSGISSNLTIFHICYNKGNPNTSPAPQPNSTQPHSPASKPKPNTSPAPQPNTTSTTSISTVGNGSTSWLRDHNFNLLLMSLISAMFLNLVK